MLKIAKVTPMFSDEQVRMIEKRYEAKFVCETCLKSNSDGWINTNFSVFYQENPPEIAKSNHFAIYFNHDGNMMITDASSALEPFDGLLLESGEVLYSRYRHDYIEYGDAMIDGGRDYMKYKPADGSKKISLKINKDQLEIVQ